MRLIDAMNIHAVISVVRLDKVADLSARLGIVRLCVELRKHVAAFEEFRRVTLSMDSKNALDILSKEVAEEVVIENVNALTEDNVRAIIEGNPELTAGQMAILMEHII
ncbi:MAG: hypothetical protein NC344_10225 [Bacteroidales bacterium]|nr:hypothetical protein [Bacteroidales bacterium]MCM1148180.1 hypothetical protein [Bacteroidales bacterium]MCM1207093.1 hypothetical protein [Bacillota bacterium]MCM1510837.1 hypothetical protein [Clostridium sp.]